MNRSIQRFAATVAWVLPASLAFIGTGHAAASGMAAGDQALVAAVHDSLDKNLGAEARDVNVTADRGVVTLTGWVDRPREEAAARTLAGQVPGVSKAYSHVRTWSSNDDF